VLHSHRTGSYSKLNGLLHVAIAVQVFHTQGRKESIAGTSDISHFNFGR
jgi:hypothetical protein